MNRAAQVKQAIRPKYFTLSYNVLEAVIAVTVGTLASSVALIGFGIDSAIEVSSGLIMLWRRNYDSNPDADRRAELAIGWSFFALAIYVLSDSARGLRAAMATFGGWWAGSAAGLILVPIIPTEGYNALKGRACQHCH